jgi:uncharacterized damage-inducible protein DinB
MLIQLLDHYAWADARTLSALTTARDTVERGRASALYGHTSAAADTWLARIEGRAPARALWAPIDLAAAADLSRRSVALLGALARGSEAELKREVAYQNSTGTTFRNTVSDCLLQVALHGVHHRAQINLLLRAAGETPPLIDYIAFLRERDGATR